MALPATDNFNRTNGALGSNWTGSVGSDLTILSNACSGSATTDCSQYWSADAPDAAQYAQVTISSITSGHYKGPVVRASGTDWVMLDAIGGTKWDIEWYNSGAYTVIGSDYATAPANGDVGKITASGSTFKGYINGTERISGSNASAPSSGYGGIYHYSTAGTVDDFEVGNLASSTTLTVTDGASTTQADAVTLAQTHAIAVNDGVAVTQADAITLVQTYNLAVNDSASTTQADAAVLTQVHILAAGDAYTSTQADAVALVQTYNLTVQDAIALAQADNLNLIPLTAIRPVSDTYTGSWTTNTGGTTNLYQAVDETPLSDADYIHSNANPSASPVVIALASGSDPLSSSDHTLRYRYGLEDSGTVNLTVQLRQAYVSEASPGTLIAEWTHNGIGVLTTAEQTLSGAQADTITDYSALFVRMVASV